ncbi:unnamed protein product [Heligmosomoides polygyrus]|uniref:Reverse transcriptase domain-containing protein n=1 Tax=Heligmosomoides polygyrus TaxID=6339 RepID=A0A183GAG1_HELPZ|nr:unnamed protein product [Heligmosomoides polygyrus]
MAGLSQGPVACNRVSVFGSARQSGQFPVAPHAKTMPHETIAPQHRSLICTLKIAPPRQKQVERCGAPRIKWWQMREKEAAVISRVRLPTVTTVHETWKMATDAIRQAAQSELGITKPGRRKVDKQAWLYTSDVKANVQEKKSLYHVFLGEKTADNWRKYQEARKAAKKAVTVAKAIHYGDVNEKLKSRNGERHLYRLAKNRHRQTECQQGRVKVPADGFSGAPLLKSLSMTRKAEPCAKEVVVRAPVELEDNGEIGQVILMVELATGKFPDTS